MGDGAVRDGKVISADRGAWLRDGARDLTGLVGRPDRWARLLCGATVAGLLCGLVGAYDSFTANPMTRLFYWIMLFWTGMAILWPSTALALHAGTRRGFPPWFSAVAAILVASVPLAAIAAAGCYLFWPVRASGIRPLDWYGQTIVIALPAIAAALWYELGPPSRTMLPADGLPAAPGVPPASGAPPLPEHLKEAALCLQMEDHHVRVHTIGRSHLHLAPLRQVAAELGPDRGIQVHRSWWVARTAVRDWQEDGRSIALLLSNGLRVPVARNRVAQLRALGWLDRS